MSSKPGTLRIKILLWPLLALLGVLVGMIFVYSLSTVTTPASTSPSGAVPSGEKLSVGELPTLAGSKRQLQLQIDGMYCPACGAAVRSKLRRLQGVSEVKVWMGGASLIYDPALINPQEIVRSATFYIYKVGVERDTPAKGF